MSKKMDQAETRDYVSKTLFKSAFQSAILSLIFLLDGVSDASSGSYFMAALAGAAAYYTIENTIQVFVLAKEISHFSVKKAKDEQ